MVTDDSGPTQTEVMGLSGPGEKPPVSRMFIIFIPSIGPSRPRLVYTAAPNPLVVSPAMRSGFPALLLSSRVVSSLAKDSPNRPEGYPSANTRYPTA